MVKNVLFLGQIFEMEILMDFHAMRAPLSENHIFSIRSVCMCVSDLRKTQKHEIFSKNRTKTRCTGAHKRILRR